MVAGFGWQPDPLELARAALHARICTHRKPAAVDFVDTLALTFEQRVRAAPESAHNEIADRLRRRDLQRGTDTGTDRGTESTVD